MHTFIILIKKNKKFIEEKKLKQQLEKKMGKMEVDFVFLLKKSELIVKDKNTLCSDNAAF